MRRVFGTAIVVILLTAVLGYTYLSYDRSRMIQIVLAHAGATDSTNSTETLVSLLNSSRTSLREKNRIIWVLGELRDPAALPALDALSSRAECDHARRVCQREVRKAIRKIEGGTPNPYFWQKTPGA